MENTENKTPEKRGFGLKLFASVGLILSIAFIAWLSVKMVGLAPSAFSSLASLAESLNDSNDSVEDQPSSFTVSSDKIIANASEPVILSWKKNDQSGTFTFTYACQEGVAVDLTNVAGLGSITCDTVYDVGSINSLELLVDSEKDRFAELSYTISFLGTNDTTPRASGNGTLTVLNNRISDPTLSLPEVLTTEPDPTKNLVEDVVADTTPKPETNAVATISGVTKKSTPAVFTPTVEVFTFTPVSDPNGLPDLGVAYRGSGTIEDNEFVPGILKQKEGGAIQFEVRNYGTRTSDTWTYSVTLPSGITYTSPKQSGLKPNERALISVGFPPIDVTQHSSIITIQTATDYSPLNDQAVANIVFAK